MLQMESALTAKKSGFTDFKYLFSVDAADILEFGCHASLRSAEFLLR